MKLNKENEQHYIMLKLQLFIIVFLCACKIMMGELDMFLAAGVISLAWTIKQNVDFYNKHKK